MRKWHRWLSIVFGAFLLFISSTGVASHVVKIWAQGSIVEPAKNERQPAAAIAAAQNGQEGNPRPAPNPTRKLIGWLHHIHSGEEFGAIGIVVSIMSGVAMIFFSFSGLWMYVQMYRGRLRIERSDPFWK
jgi:uncharacterized iron-regulated membrane protein